MSEVKINETKAIYPLAINMIQSAIKSSQEKKRISLMHIEKYVIQHYPVNINKYSPFLRRA